MLKRILVTFENLGEVEQLINYAQMLLTNYECEIMGIYIKDIRKYEVVPPMAEGIIIDSTNGFAMREWEIIEEKRAQEIKKIFNEKFPKGTFLIEEGIGSEGIMEKMKAFDLLLAAKGEYISSNLKTILKFHVKPIIIVPKTDRVSFEKVLFLDDDGIRANGALFNFFNMFNKTNEIDSLTFGKAQEAETLLTDYHDMHNIKIKRQFEENIENIKSYEVTYDLLVMGNLRYNFLLEKLTGKFGVKILEKSNIPIFLA